MTEMPLRGKTAFAAGGHQGIGRAITETLAGTGANVAAADARSAPDRRQPPLNLGCSLNSGHISTYRLFLARQFCGPECARRYHNDARMPAPAPRRRPRTALTARWLRWTA